MHRIGISKALPPGNHLSHRWLYGHKSWYAGYTVAWAFAALACF